MEAFDERFSSQIYRESIYQVLSQTTPENTQKNYGSYTINPRTRYVTVNLSSIQPKQVRTACLCNTDLSWILILDFFHRCRLKSSGLPTTRLQFRNSLSSCVVTLSD